MYSRQFLLTFIASFALMAEHGMAGPPVLLKEQVSNDPSVSQAAVVEPASGVRADFLDAVRAGDADAVAALMPQAGDRLVADGLHLAVMRRQAQVANILLAREIDLNRKLHGNYLLDTAVRNNDVEMVRLLVVHGADPDIPGRHGSPRENARESRQTEIEAILDTAPAHGPVHPVR